MTRGRRRTLRTVLIGLCILSLTGRAAGAGSLDQEADAIILEESMEIEIRSARDAAVRYSSRTKVLSKRGAERFSAAAVPYAPGISRPDLRGSVTSPDGKTRKVGKKQIVDRAAFASFELYADSRMLTIHFPAVTPGSIVEYSYEQRVSNLHRMPDTFRFQRDYPIKLGRYVLRAANDFPLRISSTDHDAGYERTEDSGMVVHSWTVRDAPAIRLDRSTPPEEDLIPKVFIAPRRIVWGDHEIDASSWNGIARFYWSLAKDRMEPTAEVAARAKTLTEGLTEPLEKTRSIYEFVRSKVNYVAISLDIGGWQPHASGEILTHLYGDCKDKVTLMIAMLRAVGLDGYPVLILTRQAGLLDRDTPYLLFNHAIAAIRTETGYLFLDPTSERTAFGDLPWIDQGVPVVVVREEGRGELTETPLFPAARNRREIRIEGRITPAGALEGEITIDAFGQERDLMTPLLEERTEDREATISRLLAWLSPGATLQSQEITAPVEPDDPLRVSGHLVVPGLVTRAGDIEIVSPHIARFPDLTWAAAYDGRDYPFFFPYLYRNTVEARLELPRGRTLKRVPDDQVLDGPGLKARTRYELVREDRLNVLIVRRSLDVTRREIPVEEYEELYAFAAALAREDAGAVTLKPGI